MTSFRDYLLPKLKRSASRDEGSAEVLASLKGGRSLEDAVVDTIESLPASATYKLRTWLEEFRGLTKPRREESDETAADELLLYLDNEADIYKMKGYVAAGLLKKFERGSYNHAFATRAWQPVVERAAKKYAKEFSSSEREWSTIFVPATRDLVAKELADRWYQNAKDGRPDEF